MLILYVTHLPLTGVAGTARSAWSAGVSKADALQNLLLYIPLGLWFVLAGWRSGWRRRTVTACAILTSLTLSVSSEFTQQCLPGRTASGWDVMFNTLGAALGIVAGLALSTAGRARRRAWVRRVAREPLLLTFGLCSALYAVTALVPMATHSGPVFGDLLAPFRALRGPQVPVDLLLDAAATIMMCTILGFLACRSLRQEFGFRRAAAGLLTVWMIFLLVLLVAAAHILLHRWTMPAIVLPGGVVGAAAGSALCWTRVGDLRSGAALGGLARAAVLLCVCFIALREVSPFNFDFRVAAVQARLGAWSWIPFQSYMRDGAFAGASGDLLVKCVRFGILGVLVSGALQARGPAAFSSRLKVGLLFCAVVATAVEAAQLACPSRYVDGTHVFAGAGAAACGIIVWQWWSDLVQACRAATAVRSGF